ncbi:MAG: lipid II flippase MurJ, partial [Pseudorhodoplanes sp.]
AANIALKIALMGSLAQVGLALATAAGAWINLLLVVWLSLRAGFFQPDKKLKSVAAKLLFAGVVLAAFFWIAEGPVGQLVRGWPLARDEAVLLALAAAGSLIYGGLIMVLLGRRWVAALAERRGGAPSE